MSVALENPENSAVPDWHALVQRIAAGDPVGEALLVERFLRGVRIAAARRLGRFHALAADIAQETMARLLERLRAGALRDADSLPGYVHACMRHVCDRELERARAHAQHASLDSETGAGSELESIASSVADPATHAEEGQLQAMVRQLFREMPVPRDREVLHRFYILQQDASRICLDLGVKHEHLHRMLWRARSRLASLLAQRGSVSVLSHMNRANAEAR